MGLLDWFRPRWKHSSPEVRREAILALPEFHHAIAEVARKDQDPSLRRLALERTEDTDLLRDRVASEDDDEVRAFAEARLAQLERGGSVGMTPVIGATTASRPAPAPAPKPAKAAPAPKPAPVRAEAPKAEAPKAPKPSKKAKEKAAKTRAPAPEKTSSTQKVKKADKFGPARKSGRLAPAAPAVQSEVLSKEEAERRYGALFAAPKPPPVAPPPVAAAPPPPVEEPADAELPEGPPPPVSFDDLDDDEPSDLHPAPVAPPPRRGRDGDVDRDEERRARAMDRRREEEEYRAWAVSLQFEALIARADALAQDEAMDPRRLARELRELRESWRALGRLPEAHAERLRSEIKAKVAPLQERTRAAFEAIDQEQAENLAKKIGMLEALEAAVEGPDLKAAGDRMRQVQDAWRTIGHVPRAQAAELSGRLRAARDRLNRRRDEARAASDAAAAGRLEQLRRLVSQAEALTVARDPSGAAERMKGLQTAWKSVGPTGPREEVDALWQRLRAAADAIFERRNTSEAAARAANEQKKQDLINRALRMAEDGEVSDPDAVVRGLQNEWRKIGPVSREANEVLWQSFREACNRLRSPPPVDPAALGDGADRLSFQPFAALTKG